MRFDLVVCVLLALGVAAAGCNGAGKVVAPDGALPARASDVEKLVTPDDNLLAGAAYVMDATAVKALAERDWLFKGSPIFDWIGIAGRSPYFVGWWNVAPEGSEGWAQPFPLRPAPRNSATLGEGKRFLVVADDEFHLLLVYPVEPEADEYMPGMDEREFREHVISLRTLYGTVRGFLMAVTDADCTIARAALCAPMRESMDASSDPEAYLVSLGVPRIPTAALMEDLSPTIRVASMAEAKAEVVVQGNDTGRARIGSGVRVQLLLTLTRTRQMMGPMGWEIVEIKKIEEQAWPSAPP
jgi:hypothetical protein